MRFSKRVKIGKGFNLNLSKSGIGMSVGGPGMSLSYGKKGLYLNTGLPGTGVSHRQRLSSSDSGIGNQYNESRSVVAEIEIDVKLDDNNNPEVLWGMDKKLPNGLIAKKGEKIQSEEILQQVKRNPLYKELLVQAAKKKAIEINNKTILLIEIFKESPRIVSHQELSNQLDKLKSPHYFEQIEGFQKPEREDSKRVLEAEAENKFKSLLFWTNKKKREDYVNLNIEKHYSQRLHIWEDMLNRAKSDLQEIVKNIELSLAGDPDFIASSVARFLESIQLPVEFSIDFEYSDTEKMLKVDLDLPEIEELPTQRAFLSATNKLSVKNKTQQELKEEYAKCTIGLAFFFASHLANISPIIEFIDISGYTQRLSKKTGHIEDQYVFSIKFNRDELTNLNVEKIDPIEAIANFSHKINLTKTYQLNPIEYPPAQSLL